MILPQVDYEGPPTRCQYISMLAVHLATRDELSDRWIEIERFISEMPSGFEISGPVIYFLFREGKIIYVGQTIELRSRLRKHKHRSFDHYAWMIVGHPSKRIVEAVWIGALRPPENCREGSSLWRMYPDLASIPVRTLIGKVHYSITHTLMATR